MIHNQIQPYNNITCAHILGEIPLNNFLLVSARASLLILKIPGSKGIHIAKLVSEVFREFLLNSCNEFYKKKGFPLY